MNTKNMRLIDADAVKDKAYPFPCAIGTEYAVTLRAINEAPAIDAVLVVRCKNCIHADKRNHRWIVCELHYENVEPDEFCSRGERFEEPTCQR